MLRSLATVGLLIILAGCTTEDPPAAEPAIVAATSPSAGIPPNDPSGTTTCHLLAQAVLNATLMDPGTVDQIVATGSTADAPLAEAAHRLATTYATALAAKGRDDEPEMIAAVSAAGAEMTTVCQDSGLDTVG